VGGAAAEGQSRSGDHHLVLELPAAVLLGLVDALGHGPEAAEVAVAAVAALGASPAASGPGRVEDCHRALLGTRGAVGAVVVIDATGTMAWTAVGNVDGLLLRPRYGRLAIRSTLIPVPGVLGMRLPALREARVGLEPGDLIVMATDGVDASFTDDLLIDDDPASAVRRVVGRRLRRHDDGLVVAARWGAPPRPS
jgi:negative regulator of sigma-B (phosphoserine phosphatase)